MKRYSIQTNAGLWEYSESVKIRRKLLITCRNARGIDLQQAWLISVLLWAEFGLPIKWFVDNGMDKRIAEKQLLLLQEAGYAHRDVDLWMATTKLIKANIRINKEDPILNFHMVSLFAKNMTIGDRMVHSIFLARLYGSKGYSRRGFCREFNISSRTWMKWVFRINELGFCEITWRHREDKLRMASELVCFPNHKSLLSTVSHNTEAIEGSSLTRFYKKIAGARECKPENVNRRARECKPENVNQGELNSGESSGELNCGNSSSNSEPHSIEMVSEDDKKINEWLERLKRGEL